MCNVLRQASRAVTRLYDEELRTVGIRVTQYSLLRAIARLGEVQQGELGTVAHLDQTTITRNIRPLVDAGWVAVSKGQDQREKRIAITKKGKAMLAKARPCWERAQSRTKALVSKEAWNLLLEVLPETTARVAEK